MIVNYLNEMRNVTLVDGCFDPVHHGHIEYFRKASAFGDPLFCYVSGDHYLSKKHKPLLSGDKRIIVIDAIKYISFSHLGTVSTADALARIRPKRYVKGKDWQAKGLPREQIEICQEFGIKIEFVEANLDSSSRLLSNFMEP